MFATIGLAQDPGWPRQKTNSASRFQHHLQQKPEARMFPPSYFYELRDLPVKCKLARQLEGLAKLGWVAAAGCEAGSPQISNVTYQAGLGARRISLRRRCLP